MVQSVHGKLSSVLGLYPCKSTAAGKLSWTFKKVAERRVGPEVSEGESTTGTSAKLFGFVTGRDDGLALTRVPNAPRTDKATMDRAIPLDISSVRQHDGTKMRCNRKTLSCTLV